VFDSLKIATQESLTWKLD